MHLTVVLRSVVAALALGLVAACPAAAAPALTSSHGITVRGVEQLSPRLLDVSLTSSVVDGPLHVRILLPSGYDQQPERRWPVSARRTSPRASARRQPA